MLRASSAGLDTEAAVTLALASISLGSNILALHRELGALPADDPCVGQIRGQLRRLAEGLDSHQAIAEGFAQLAGQDAMRDGHSEMSERLFRIGATLCKFPAAPSVLLG